MKWDSYLAKQYHSRCMSCSSVKESPADNSSGIQGVNFEGIIDEQHDTSKQDSSTLGIEWKQSRLIFTQTSFHSSLRL